MRNVLLALSVGMIVSTSLGLMEFLSIYTLISKDLSAPVPISLLAAAAGQAVITHLLFWLPVSILYYGAFGRWLRRAKHGLLPSLSALFVVAVGLIIMPADIRLAPGRHRSLEIAVMVAGLLAGVATYKLIGYIIQRFGTKPVERMVYRLAGVASVIALTLAIFFARSPYVNADTFRTAPLTKVPHTQDQPNLLWIVLDTVKPSRMSVHGYDKSTTPFLDQWSSQAIVFDRAISPGTWTGPSHASMFTGLSVREHGVNFDHVWLDDDLTTVAEVLSRHGFHTALFSNNPWISPSTNLSKGFDYVQMMNHVRHLSRFSLEFLIQEWGITPPFPWCDTDYGAATTNDLIRQHLDEHTQRDAPLFLLVNYMEAHLPYRVPKRYRRMFMTDEQTRRSYALRESAYGSLFEALLRRFNLEDRTFLPEADREILSRQYDASIRYLDDRVAELIGMFEQRGLLDNTVVVIVSDHGEHLDSHNLWGHEFLAYNDLLHVSLLLREPGRSKPIRISSPVQTSELFPTVLSMVLGQKPKPGRFAPRDLLQVAELGGEARTVVSEYAGPWPKTRDRIRRMDGTDRVDLIVPCIAVQDARYKFIVSTQGQREFYDLVTDPNELLNALDQHPAEVNRFAEFLKDWYQAVEPYRSKGNQVVPDLAPGVLDSLRSLGYVGD